MGGVLCCSRGDLGFATPQGHSLAFPQRIHGMSNGVSVNIWDQQGRDESMDVLGRGWKHLQDFWVMDVTLDRL